MLHLFLTHFFAFRAYYLYLEPLVSRKSKRTNKNIPQWALASRTFCVLCINFVAACTNGGQIIFMFFLGSRGVVFIDRSGAKFLL